MKVVFDSNVIIADRWLAGADFRALASTRRETGHELVVPMLALDEAVNDYKEHLASAERDLAKATENLTRLLHRPYVAPDVERETLVREYRGALLETLRRSGARLAPYPRVPHEKVVKRALERRRPFDDKGRNGYRDVLMWHSVLAELQGPGGVAFVSNDTGFYDLPRESRRTEARPANDPAADAMATNSQQRRPSAMHPHLEPDLLGRGGAPMMFLSLREFVEREVNPRLARASATTEMLEGEVPYEGFDVRKAALEHLLSGFRYFVLDPTMLGMPPEVEHASVISVEEVVRAEVQSARRAGTEVVLDLVVECEVRVETYAWQETPTPEDVGLPRASDDEFLDEELPRVLLRVEAAMLVDPKSRSVTAIEIQNVDPVR